MNKISSGPDLRQIISLLPRNILNTSVLIWTLPLSLVLAVTSTPISVSGVREVLIWLAIGALGHLAMAPFVLYGKGKDLPEQILLVLLMGFTRGGVISLLAPLFDVRDQLPPVQRIANTTVAVFYWFYAGSIIVDYGVEFRKKLRDLLNEVIEKKIVGLPEAAKSSQNAIVEIIGHLHQRIVSIVGTSPSKEELRNASQEIDQLITNYIKPMSQSKWRDGEFVWVRAGFFAVLRRTLKINPLPVISVIILTFPFTLVAQISSIGFAQTLQLQIVWTTLAVLLAKSVIKVPSKSGEYLRANSIFLALLPLAYFATFVVQQISPLNNPQNGSQMIRGYLTSYLAQLCAYLIGTLLLALRSDQDFVFEFIGDLIKAGELEKLLAKTNSGNLDASYAQYLHAEVQSQLLACKLLLLKAAESDFELFPPEVTKQIVERMEKIQQPYEKPAARIPAKRLVELQSSWAGIADIAFELPEVFSESHAYSDITTQLIEESVVNSIRHGKATAIEITGSSDGEKLSVNVVDNGKLGELSGHSGLGTILFRTFAQTWNLQAIDGKTILNFTISTSERA
jgi:hypothetical protein